MDNPVFAEIQSQIDSTPVMLFMKGTPMFPQCGFSARVIQILKHADVPYKTVNVLEDPEIREGIKLLAQCEGIFAETAGGVTVGVAKKLIASGAIPADDAAVLCITGHGLKTLDAVAGHAGYTREIKPSLREFESLLDAETRTLARS